MYSFIYVRKLTCITLFFSSFNYYSKPEHDIVIIIPFVFLEFVKKRLQYTSPSFQICVCIISRDKLVFVKVNNAHTFSNHE